MPELINSDIPFARPFIGEAEEAAVLRVLRSGWLTTGVEALALEKEFAQFLQKDLSPSTDNIHCLAVNSATSGLHLALEACGVGQGDVILVPSCTFTATAEVARYLGADPVFVDVSPGTFHIDPNALEETILRLRPKKPKAVIPVHYGGLPCDMGAILAIAKRYGLKVIEDAAHAFPSLMGSGDQGLGTREKRGTRVRGSGIGDCYSNYNSASELQSDTSNNDPQSLIPSPQSPFFAGTVGDIGVFSFYATKTITTGEGGMIVCCDETMAKRISVMRSHGIDRAVWNRYSDTRASWYYEVVEAGYKYNLPDILAAIGRVQLSRAWELLQMRKEIAAAYDLAFGGMACFQLPPTGPADARHLYPLRLDPQRLNISRDAFIQKLQEAGIGTSVHFIPLHIMPFYRNRYHLAEYDFPETMKSCKQEISLPIWPGMGKDQINKVIEVVQSIANSYTV
jgi:dTDP-4-amino-4,6-dideoxygalactose transaminase